MISRPTVARLMEILHELALGRGAWVEDHFGHLGQEYVAVLAAIEDLVSCAAGPELGKTLRETREG